MEFLRSSPQTNLAGKPEMELKKKTPEKRDSSVSNKYLCGLLHK